MQHALFTAKFFPPLTKRVDAGHSRLYTLYSRPLPGLERRSMIDRGLFVATQAIRRQLHAMPCELYLVRLMHHATGRAFPGERVWTASQVSQPATVRFLRIRNREGCDVDLQPFAGDRNAGYILVDLDHAEPSVLDAMRRNGHEPCVVLKSSPRRWQAWIRVSAVPLQPAVATAIGGYLARTYGGDPASIDWRHRRFRGRLGFGSG